jgi:photosystem II stability/assembly factor-like uncharacterized protein
MNLQTVSAVLALSLVTGCTIINRPTEQPADDPDAPAAPADPKAGANASGWSQLAVDDSTIESVRFTDAMHGFALASDGASEGLLYTDDGGATWSHREVEVTPFGIGSSANSEQLWVVGSGPKSVWTSSDKGQTFAPLATTPGGWPAALHFFDLKTILVTDETGDTVSLSTDGGATWNKHAFTRDILPGTKALTVRGADAWIVGGPSYTPDGSGANIAHSPDSGKTWEITQLKDGAHLHKGGSLHALAAVSANEQWAAGDNRQLFHTTDGWKTSTQVKGIPASIHSFGGIVVRGSKISLAASSDAGYALYQSTDGGKTFQVTDDRGCPNPALCDDNGVHGMAASADGSVLFVYGYAGLLWKYPG